MGFIDSSNDPRSKALIAILFLVLALYTPQFALGAPGDFDDTFGPGGAAQFASPYLFSPVEVPGKPQLRWTALAMQSDGKILVASATDASSPRMILRRFNSNGTRDNSFGLSGEAVAEVFPTRFVYGIPKVVLVQPDGKVVVAGYYYSDDERRLSVWRFTSTGVLDTTFGGDGWVTRFNSTDAEPLAVAILNGKILVASTNDAISCIDSTGGACPTFGLFGYINAEADSLAVVPRSRRFLTSSYGRVRRFDENGQLDTSFADVDIAEECFNEELPSYNYSGGLAVQNDGKIVVGFSFYYFEFEFTHSLARLNSSGTLDATFSVGGCLDDQTAVPNGKYGKLQSFAVQPDGKIVALVDAGNSQNETFTLLRLTTDGSIDPTFTAAGTLPRNQDMLIQPADGKIVTVGNDREFIQSEWLWRHRNFYLARYLP